MATENWISKAIHSNQLTMVIMSPWEKFLSSLAVPVQESLDYLESLIQSVLDYLISRLRSIWNKEEIYPFGWRYLLEKILCNDGALPKWFTTILVFLEYLALLLQNFFQYLLLFGNFVEFPNRRRPKCTTMPWNIWPSLVVLWGVCWMFEANSNHTDDFLDNLFSVDRYSQLPLPSPHESLEFVSPTVPGSVPPVQQDLALLCDVSWASLGFGTEDGASGDSGLNPLGNSDFFDHSLSAASTGLQYPDTIIDEASIGFQLQDVLDLMPADPVPFAEGAWQPQLSQIMPIDPPMTNQFNSLSDRFSTSIMVRPNSPLQQTPLPSQRPRASARAENPILNADGKMICNYLCSNTQTFEQRCHWQTHINKHERPFRCEVEGCADKTAGFATEAERKRHNRTHKRRIGGDIGDLFHCTVSGCRYTATGNYGFVRKDQLREHMRRAHSEIPLPPDLVPRTAKVSNTAILTGTLIASGETMNRSPPAPDLKKRKRKPDANLATEEASQDSEKDVSSRQQKSVKKNERLEKQSESSETEVERLKRQLESSDREVKRLGSEVEKGHEMNQKLQEMNQKLVEVIDRLTQKGT